VISANGKGKSKADKKVKVLPVEIATELSAKKFKEHYMKTKRLKNKVIDLTYTEV
jgi:hypothetical protein